MACRTTHPTTWFAAGVFSSWSAGTLIETAGATRPGRWNTETGVWMGLFAAALIAGLMGLIWWAWLAWRCRCQTPLRPHFAAPLVFGLLDPLLAVGLMAGTVRLVGLHPILNLALPVVVFGVPVLLAEGLIRLARRGWA